MLGKLPVKVELREMRHPGQLLDAQGLVQVLLHVAEHPLESLCVRLCRFLAHRLPRNSILAHPNMPPGGIPDRYCSMLRVP